jgi:peptide/nickel transport system substrate-binding protein
MRCSTGFTMTTIAVALTASLTACAPGTPRSADGLASTDNSVPVEPARVKSITVATSAPRPVLHSKLHGGAGGFARWYWLANGYLTALDASETPNAILAEEIPSLDRKTWTTNPDGTMETIYRIRSAAKWHDGQPVVAKDFAFAWEVYLDPEFPAFDRGVEKLISGIDTPDDRTLVIRWAEIYTGANSVGAGALEPLPSHLLEDLYRTNKAAFIDPNGKHWSSEFIGAGPFRAEQWVPSDGQYYLAAHDGFALGRPKIDRIVINVIDKNAILPSILAGAVDVMFDDVATEVALTLREQWEVQGKGTVGIALGGMRYLTFQQRDIPGAQPAVRDFRVRRALGYAIDRVGLENLQPPGFTPAAYYAMNPRDRLYPLVDRTVPKYANDPAAAERLLDDAGYPRGSDLLRRGASADPLTASLLTSPGPEDEGVATVLSDNWRRTGVGGDVTTIPPARASDSEFQATFPAVNMKSTSPRFDKFEWTSDRIPGPGNRWSGQNWGAYSSPEADRLSAAILRTIDQNERDRLIVSLVGIWTEDSAIIPYLFKSRYLIAAASIGGYDAAVSSVQTAHAWNIYNWTKS